MGEAKRLTEGTRFPYLNSMLAAASNWVEISEKAASAFIHLLAAVRAPETGEDPGVQMAVGAYMQCILQYELVGRKGADKAGWEFGWDSIQAYMGPNFACTNSVCASTCQCKPCAVCAQVEQMYSFFGPSPRVLYEEAVGRHDPLQFYLCLSFKTACKQIITIYKQTNRQTDRQTDKQTNKQTYIPSFMLQHNSRIYKNHAIKI